MDASGAGWALLAVLAVAGCSEQPCSVRVGTRRFGAAEVCAYSAATGRPPREAAEALVAVELLRRDAAEQGAAAGEADPIAALVQDERDRAAAGGVDVVVGELKAASPYLSSRRIQGDGLAERMAVDALALQRLRDRVRELRRRTPVVIEGACGRCD